jgi:hypothetical protein
MVLTTKRGNRCLRASQCFCSLLLAFVLFFPSGATLVMAQSAAADHPTKETDSDFFRLETTAVPGGAELITIHARWEGLEPSSAPNWVPMVSVLRDTLGDADPENDRLRYVWPLSYTHPTLWQRLTSAVPFLYSRVGNKQHISKKAPPPAIDLAASDRDVWEKVFWMALQNVLLDPYGAPVKASTRSYRRNVTDYRKSQIVRALAVLSLYQSMSNDSVFSNSEMAEIQSRLLLTDKTFGGLLDELNLHRFYEKDLVQTRDERGHNWELLRQRAEAESLFFEPMQMPDGSMTHALLWVAKSELTKEIKPFNKRFLNIANPWGDKRLLNWKGYSDVRYFDSDHRPVAADAQGAIPVEMIPLGLYGLDNPKIPMLLVDFRDGMNPKRREMSQRLIQDVTKNVLSLSKFDDVPYFVGRSVFDFVTGRRGMDINQPSRLRTYSQLKLLLALNESLDPDLRGEIANRLEKVSLNPLENDLNVEAQVARQQFASLLEFAKAPNGLATQLEKDRRSELVPLEHGRAEQVLFRLANILSFGKYVHREKATAQLESRLDIARRLNFHTNFLREVSRSGPRVDVKWDLEDVRRSLFFLSQHGGQVNSSAISSVARIFSRTSDEETRRACLESLARINNPKARQELTRIAANQTLDPALRDLVTSYLANPHFRSEPLTSSIKSEGNRTGQQ